MTEQTPEPAHWPTERMIQEGHPDCATPEDLEELDGQALYAVADICEVSEMAPDECIPCLALAKVLDQQKDAVEEFTPVDSDVDEEEDDGVVLPKLAATLSAVPPWTESDRQDYDAESVADQFASKVVELNLLVEELLNGPPIPPKGVTMVDLSLLLLAADKWVQMSEIQGGLAPQQQQMLDATKDLVARLRA